MSVDVYVEGPDGHRLEAVEPTGDMAREGWFIAVCECGHAVEGPEDRVAKARWWAHTVLASS